MTLQDIAGAAPGVADGLIKDTTTQAFMKDVIEESKRQPVLVDFWAEWCGPCKQLTPVLEKAVNAAKGKVKLVKMDIDKHPAIPGQMGIQSIPAVIAFVNGQPADGFMGALPESQVKDFIARITKDKLGGEAQDFQDRDEALAWNAEDAAALYSEVLREDPANVPALAGLARAHVTTGELDQAKQTLARIPEAKRNDAAVAAAHSALEVAEQAKSVGPVGELEQKVAANPLDHQARFDLAVALKCCRQSARSGGPSARERQRDRKWNDRARASSSCSFSRRGALPTRRRSTARKLNGSILFA